MSGRGYEDLVVWQKSLDLVAAVYDVTKPFPSDERYGLTSQIRRCAVSIPSNIAEGAARNTVGEFGQFLGVALGSVAELHTQLTLAQMLGYLSERDFDSVMSGLRAIQKMLSSLKASIKSKPKLATSNM